MLTNTPDWVKNSVFYQVLPDRFRRSMRAKSDVLQKSLVLDEWTAKPTLRGYKGGDLWGVIEGLDYLKSLQVNAIYLNPIFQATSYHRYHTEDYYKVDWLLGGDKAFFSLLEKAHDYEIKVILDGVFHHVGRGFCFFNDVLENDFLNMETPGRYLGCSPWKEWFVLNEKNWPISAYDGSRPANYGCWEGYRALVKLNHRNRDVREYIMRVAEYWIQAGIDGWRIDGPLYINLIEEDIHDFWQEFRNRVKQINSEAYILGEIWYEAESWLDGTQFDGTINYLFTAPTLAFVAGKRIQPELLNNAFKDYARASDENEPNRSFFERFESLYALQPLNAEEYSVRIEALLKRYSWQHQLAQLNLLASHDTARLITLMDGDKSSVELALLLLMTFPGSPCIYYGDEVGLEGGLDPDNRRGFPNEDQWDQKTLATYRQLISLRQKNPALRTGSYQFLCAQKGLYVFARILGTDEIIIAVNTDETSSEICCSLSGLRLPGGTIETLRSHPNKVIYGEGNFTWSSENDLPKLILWLPPRQGLALSGTS